MTSTFASKDEVEEVLVALCISMDDYEWRSHSGGDYLYIKNTSSFIVSPHRDGGFKFSNDLVDTAKNTHNSVTQDLEVDNELGEYKGILIQDKSGNIRLEIDSIGLAYLGDIKVVITGPMQEQSIDNFIGQNVFAECTTDQSGAIRVDGIFTPNGWKTRDKS